MRKPKTIVEFVADFFRDEKLRRRLLWNHDVAMSEYGLDDDQQIVLRTLLGDRIKTEMLLELQDLIDDTAKKKVDVDAHLAPGGLAPLAVLSFYDGGKFHVFGVDPGEITLYRSTRVTVRGNGMLGTPEFLFTHEDDLTVPPIDVTAYSLDSETDLNQYAVVRVTLPVAGKWQVQGKNAGDANWSTEDIGHVVVV